MLENIAKLKRNLRTENNMRTAHEDMTVHIDLDVKLAALRISTSIEIIEKTENNCGFIEKINHENEKMQNQFKKRCCAYYSQFRT